MTKSLALVAIVSSFFAAARTAKTEQREVRTPYYSLALTPDGTSIESLSVDSLGKDEFRPSVLFPPEAKPSAQVAVPANAICSSDWQFKFSSQSFQMVSTYRSDAPGACPARHFQLHAGHARATASFAYFTVAALYGLGRIDDGDRILFPMLDSFAKGDFQGYCANKNSKDWKMWDGTCTGYEGLLVDNYYALLAVLDREAALKRKR